jgi:hypothetical protein
MDKQALRKELTRIHDTVARSGRSTVTTDNTDSSSLIEKRAPAYTGEKNSTSRKGNLLRAIGAGLRKPPKSTNHSPRSTYQLNGGWYNEGFPKPRIYRAEELMSFWRVCLKLKYRDQCPETRYPFFLRPQLLSWLKAEGYQRCEAIVAYAVEMWEPLCDRFEIREQDHPTLNVIWGFRAAFSKEMDHTGSKKWGGHWNENEEEDFREEVS